MIKVIWLFPFLFFSSTLAIAQIELNGSLDAGISSGGENSAFISNGIEHEYHFLHFSIPQVNLLLFAPINDNFYFEGRLQSDTWGTGTLGYPRFTLANITYTSSDNNHSLSTGRFISPFGFYPSRNLTIDRTFTDFPLSYSYYLNMSDLHGYWPAARYENDYSYDGGLMTSVYFGGYATGLRWDWEVQENQLHLQTAVTTVAPGSSRNYTNLGNAAVMSRLIYKPNIEWQFGISVSHGSFMHSDSTANGVIRQDTPLEKYRQSLAGFDFKYGLGFWEIVGEAIFSNWRVPKYVNESYLYSGNSPNTYHLSNFGTNVDIKFEPPFFTGSYLAFRFDHLNFLEEDPNTEANMYDSQDWDKDLLRLSAAFGYKLARNAEVKLLVSDQTPFNFSQYAFKAMITAFF
ncbi:MAG: hypothetical protein WD059_16170 [Balneolaceae bacterium]